ncbi:MAG: FG-GAP repeat protein [Chloroflexi bacterium]|nr:FG-GAP repeat protein [Chloroflexota bacterium]MDA1174531.1 FG-GAP repeat protein [Chloroflexota bacterium]
MLGPFVMRRRFPWNVAFFAALATLVLTMHASVAADLPAAFAATGDTNEVAKLIASGAQASDYAGSSIAVSGDTAVLGAYRRDVGGNVDQGVAVVFVRNGTTWTEQTELTASDGAANHGFGFSLDISGDTVVVYGGGAIYVFVRTGTTWTQQQKLTAPIGSETSWGQSVAVDGDTVVVGGFGSAHVFVRTEGTWGAPQALTAIGGLDGDAFGASVAVDGDTVIVSAPVAAWIDELDSASPGAAFVFVRGESSWSQQQKLTASDGVEYDRFGSSVGLSGNTVVVGAEDSNPGGNLDQGSAYVYYRSGTAWSQQAKLTASDGVAGD